MEYIEVSRAEYALSKLKKHRLTTGIQLALIRMIARHRAAAEESQP